MARGHYYYYYYYYYYYDGAGSFGTIWWTDSLPPPTLPAHAHGQRPTVNTVSGMVGDRLDTDILFGKNNGCLAQQHRHLYLALFAPPVLNSCVSLHAV